MAKRSQRSHVRRAKDRLICVWGLMSILDFRHFRSPRKMLTYKRQRSREALGSGKSTNKIDESPKSHENLRGTRVNQEVTTSVKTLIEEDMGKEPKQSDPGRGHQKENAAKSKRRFKQSQSLNKRELKEGKSRELKCSCQQNMQQSSENIPAKKDNNSEEFCHQIPYHVDERLCEASEEINCEMTQASNKIVILKPEVLETRPPDENGHTQPPNTIVLLKPELIISEPTNLRNAIDKEHGVGWITTRSFLSSIKRRLRSAISLSKDRFHVEKSSQVNAREKSHKTVNDTELRVSRIYIEAKKYLSEMLNDGDEGSEILTAGISDKLGRILSLPEFNSSSMGSPRTDTSLTGRSSFSHVVKFPGQMESEAESNPVAPMEQSPEIGSSVCERLAEETTLATVDLTNSEENTRQSDRASPESGSSGHLTEASDDDEFEQQNCDDENGSELSSSLSHPSVLFVVKAEDLEIGIDKAEQPSPVSVLDPLFTEDDYSPTRTTSRFREHPIRLLQIEFEDADEFAASQHINAETFDKDSIIDFVKAVLHTSELNWDELYLKSPSSDEQLLESLLLQEVDFLGDFHFHDKKLLLDCINEALLEFFDHYSIFPCFYVSNKTNPVPKVCERVYWHLLQPPLPRTLEQIVGKDLSGTDVWMDLHLEAESLGVDMGDIILEELIQDAFMGIENMNLENAFMGIENMNLENDEMPTFSAGVIHL